MALRRGRPEGRGQGVGEEKVDDDGEEDEDDEDEDDEEEEEEEPRLKYQRLGNSVPEILKREAASSVRVHEKFVALGTHEGWIYILDFNGNEIRRFGAHTAIVNDLSFDRLGEFIASCSDDGTVVINGLYSAECESFTYQRPVKALALDPKFSRKGNRQFVSGGLSQQLLLNEKGWFSNKDKVVHSGEGAIYAVAWAESLMAWANDAGVKIFDNAANKRITYIDRPEGSARADLFRPHLVWETPSLLLIGWADYVKIAQVKERPAREGVGAQKYVEILAFFHTDFYIAGLAPLDGGLLVLLAYVVDAEGGNKAAERPELRILTRSNEEVSSDALSMHGFERLAAKDYRLAHLHQHSVLYIVSPRDIVVARARDLDDHLSWLIARRMYAQAVAEAEEKADQVQRHRLQDIGEKYLGQLTEAREFETAAALCPRLLKQQAGLWEKWVAVFCKIAQHAVIAPYIPVRNPQLSPDTYTQMLLHFLEADEEMFLKLLQDWPAAVYSVPELIKAVKLKLRGEHSQGTEEGLARLLVLGGDSEAALELYLKLNRKDAAFSLIDKFQLFPAVKDRVLDLLRFDHPRALKLFVNNTDKITPAHVVPQLAEERGLQHEYLAALFDKDPRAAPHHHEMQVGLYAEFDYPKLLPFLRQSSHYRLETALQLCQDKELYPEMVFVLARMGDAKQALQLLVERVGDVGEALAFCQEHADEELWEHLITLCLSRPSLVAPLLQDIGAHVDPIKVVKRIPMGMKIEGLREKLSKIIADYHLQMSLREGCEHILKSDVVLLGRRLNRLQRRALRVDSRSRCGLTGAPVVGGGNNLLLQPYPGLVTFFGGRVYQEDALVSLCQAEHEVEAGAGEGDHPAARPQGPAPGPGGGRGGGPGGDAAAAARMVMQKGFVVEGKQLVRGGAARR